MTDPISDRSYCPSYSTYPAVEYEGGFVVEAYAHTHDLLPHLHENLEELFPRAVAKEEKEEGEDVTPCTLEVRGEARGKETATTTTTKPATAATTTTTTTTTTTMTTSRPLLSTYLARIRQRA